MISKSINNKSSVSLIQDETVKKPLLTVENLDMFFKIRGWYFKALDNISFDVNEGDFFGIIGESGSGKSTTGKCIIRLYQPTGGKIEIENNLVSNKRLIRKTKKWLHKNVQMVFQDPMASLNPTKNILQLISEPLAINKSLYKDAYRKWKELNSVSKYLFVDFMTQKNRLLQDFRINYLSILKGKMTETIQTLNATNFSNDNFATAREKLIFNMDTFVEKMSGTTNLIYEFSNNFQEISKKLTERYLDTDYDVAYKDYENLLLEFKNVRKIYKYSLKGKETKEKIGFFESEIKDLNEQFREIYSKQNSRYIKSWEATVKGKIKSIHQSLEFSKNDLGYTLNYVELFVKKSELIFVKKLKKYKKLSESLINITIKNVAEVLDNLFAPLRDFVSKSNLFFEKADPIQKNEIIKNLKSVRKFADIFYEIEKHNHWSNHKLIKSKFSAVFNQNPDLDLFDVNDFEKFFNFQFVANQKMHSVFVKVKQNHLLNLQKYGVIKKNLKTRLLSLKKEFGLVTHQYKKGSAEFNENKSKYDDSKSAFEASKDRRNTHITEIVKGQAANEQREFMNETNKELAFIRKNYVSVKKELKKTINMQLRSIQRIVLKREKHFFKTSNLFSTFKKEIKLRWKTLKAIEFEYNNAIKEVKTCSYICEVRSYFNWWKLLSLVKVTKRDCVYKALDSVGLKREHAYRYPHEFSGGQRQRIVIARALINNPKVIIADEPISALDVSIQAQIINILQDLCIKQKVTILLIAHDLSMVNYACNNVIIMHRGKILEKGNVQEIFKNPIHPYTRSLMKATPKLSRVHVDLAAFSDDFTYDKDWDAFNKPEFVKINNNKNHQVFGTVNQINEWINLQQEDDE